MHLYLTCSVVDSWLHIEFTTNTFLNVVRNYETYMSSKIKGDFKCTQEQRILNFTKTSIYNENQRIQVYFIAAEI